MPYVSRGAACTTLPQRPTLSRPQPTQQHYSSCLSVTRHPYLFTPPIQPLTAPHFPSTQNPLHPPATMRIERGNFPCQPKNKSQPIESTRKKARARSRPKAAPPFVSTASNTDSPPKPCPPKATPNPIAHHV